MRPTRFAVLVLTAGLLFAQPVIVVNNSTGSDTTTSGAPSSFGPFSAAATCHTNGLASTTIQWAANPLTGVPTDGSAAIWLATAAGRRWSRISARDANTVTVTDSFNIAAGTPVDCAVGGKRLSLTATRLFLDLKGTEAPTFSEGWTLRIENTGSNYTTATTLATSASQIGCMIEGDTTGVRPVLEGTADNTLVSLDSCDLRHLSFINSAVAKTASVGVGASQNPGGIISDTIVGGSTVATSFFRGVVMPVGGTLYNSEIRFNATGVRYGCGGTVKGLACRILWNYIHNNATGINDAGDLGNNAWVFRNLIVNNTGDGILIGSTSTSISYFVENVIDGNGGDGIDMTAANAAEAHGFIGNQITNNGLFGMTCTSGRGCGVRVDNGIVAFNNLFNNTSGARNNYLAGDSETTIDPGYVNRAAGNYCTTLPTPTPDGGPPGAGVKYPGSQTGSILRRGACQPLGGGGGANVGI